MEKGAIAMHAENKGRQFWHYGIPVHVVKEYKESPGEVLIQHDADGTKTNAKWSELSVTKPEPKLVKAPETASKTSTPAEKKDSRRQSKETKRKPKSTPRRQPKASSMKRKRVQKAAPRRKTQSRRQAMPSNNKDSKSVMQIIIAARQLENRGQSDLQQLQSKVQRIEDELEVRSPEAALTEIRELKKDVTFHTAEEDRWYTRAKAAEAQLETIKSGLKKGFSALMGAKPRRKTTKKGPRLVKRTKKAA